MKGSFVMGNSSRVLLLTSFALCLYCFLIGSVGVNSQLLIPEDFAEPACSLVDCGEGTCKPSNSTPFGVECECDPGWKKIQIGPSTLASCVVPNCTLDLNCGSGVPPPFPPPAPLSPPITNITDRCAFAWCGYGTCVANETDHICKCNEGSANLLNTTSLPCLKACNLGADCHGIGLGGNP